MRYGQTRLSKEQRQRILEAHIIHWDNQKKELPKDEMLRLLRIAGYNISLATLYNDLKDIASNDSFIADLASKTYSSIMHTAFNSYNKIYTLAMKVHDSEEQLTRKIKRQTEKGITEETIRENNPSVKLQALMVAKNAQDSIRAMVNGENLHMSAGKWIQVTKLQELTIEGLRQKLKKYEIPQDASGASNGLDLDI